MVTTGFGAQGGRASVFRPRLSSLGSLPSDLCPLISQSSGTQAPCSRPPPSSLEMAYKFCYSEACRLLRATVRPATGISPSIGSITSTFAAGPAAQKDGLCWGQYMRNSPGPAWHGRGIQKGYCAVGCRDERGGVGFPNKP